MKEKVSYTQRWMDSCLKLVNQYKAYKIGLSQTICVQFHQIQGKIN